MAINSANAARVRDYLQPVPGVSEKKMFGGLGFLLRGNLFVALWEDFLILRLGPQAATALAEEFVREFDLTGRAMTGWVMIESDGFDKDADLRKWLERAREFAAGLPTKRVLKKSVRPKKGGDGKPPPREKRRKK